MKKTLIVAVVLMGPVLFGCNKAKEVVTSTTPTTSKILQNANDSSAPIQRLELTDPVLYEYLTQSGIVTGFSNASANLPTGSQKLNKLVQIGEDTVNKINGTMQIVSSGNIYLIKVANFNYNGKCGQITFALGVNSLPKSPIHEFTPISGPQSNAQFELQIPSSIDLIQFDTVNIYCPDQEMPVSRTRF